MLTVSCHCGSVTLELPRAPRVLTQCNCSICRRYGALWAYYRRRSVRVNAAPGALVTYVWRKRVREYRHCKRCGCVTHYEQRVKRKDGSDTLAVNLRNVDQPELVAAARIKLLDGAGSWACLEERQQPYLLGSPGAKRGKAQSGALTAPGASPPRAARGGGARSGPRAGAARRRG